MACTQTVNKPIKYEQVDTSVFSNAIGNVPIPVISNNDVNAIVNDISDTIYNCVKSCSSVDLARNRSLGLSTNSIFNNQPKSYHSKWDQLLNDPDDSRVWKALDWKGEFIDNNISKNQSSPSDSEFKDLYEVQINQYFNPNEIYIPDDNYLTNIPVLDDNFTPFEVTEQINKLKSNKSCGPDGIPPGIYKLLNNEWILLLTTLFNIIFSNAIYPLQ